MSPSSGFRGAAGLLAAAALLTPAPASAQALEWDALAPIPDGQINFAAAAYGRKIYLIGSASSPYGVVQVYDIDSNSWSLGPQLPDGRRRYNGVAEAFGDRIHFLSGGGNGVFAPAYVQMKDYLDLTQDPPVWIENGAWSQRHSSASAIALNFIWLAGGRIADTASETVEFYNPATNVGQVFNENLSIARQSLTLEAVDGTLYAIGGFTREPGTEFGNPSAANESLTPTVTGWEAAADMPTPRGFLGSAVVDGKIYAIGGTVRDGDTFFGTPTDAVEAYDPETNSWTTEASLPAPASLIRAVTVDGVIYAFSGQNGAAYRGSFGDLPTPSPVETPTPSPTPTEPPTPSPTPTAPPTPSPSQPPTPSPTQAPTPSPTQPPTPSPTQPPTPSPTQPPTPSPTQPPTPSPTRPPTSTQPPTPSPTQPPTPSQTPSQPSTPDADSDGGGCRLSQRWRQLG